MRTFYNGQEPLEWITEDEDGEINWDKWVTMWGSLEYRFSFDAAKSMKVEGR